jgi:hypothetical protein
MTSAFQTAYSGLPEVDQCSIQDFLSLLQTDDKGHGIFHPRNHSCNFIEDILPSLQLLCASFKLTSSGYNASGEKEYHVSWTASDLVVPDFIIQDADAGWERFMRMTGLDEE